MDVLTKNEETIFSAAAQLFQVSQILKDLTPDVSNAVLFLSDRLLKDVEKETISEDSDPQLTESNHENCPDCGGIKNEVPHNHENCPDCGGVKQTFNVDPIVVIEETKSPNQCNGHDGAGAGCHGHSSAGESQPDNSEPLLVTKTGDVKKDVTELIHKIRKGL